VEQGPYISQNQPLCLCSIFLNEVINNEKLLITLKRYERKIMEIGLYGNRSIRRYPTNNTDIRKPENI
jgi:hypothetical protein